MRRFDRLDDGLVHDDQHLLGAGGNRGPLLEVLLGSDGIESP